MACGVGDYTRGLAETLARRPGVQVAVLTSMDASGASSGAPYQVFPVVRDWTLADLRTVGKVIRRWNPDVAHLQYPTQGYRRYQAWLFPLLLRILFRVPVVQTWHEYVPERFRLALWHAFLALAPGDVIVVRPNYRERMPWWFRSLFRRKVLHLVANAPSLPQVLLTDSDRRAIQLRYAPDGRALVAHFGFLFEHKGVDDLLEILDFERHHLVLVGDVKEWDPYQVALVRRLSAPPFVDHVTMAGFLPAFEAARVLAAADAVVLPFRQGGGSWNTSIKAAILQGTFVLTTSTEERGFDAARNVYYARPGDIRELRQALSEHLGRRNRDPAPTAAGETWEEIAQRHHELYEREIWKG